ncbi:THUMP domain protein [Methanocaldococcus infernus ME]|uniref:THUMP domain protein n=1 Tax=Methanocaldococcus infernus (strain DSM 11812 / JCM 15783 / ME) TaxID=573063 RepID=D5VSP7_METIM|nr:THUMP domain-containing protein [Methanocaldococcus infernus]ADG13600.1 THUMP domain protein [Methanocaldococcus infernus ME]
MKTLALITTKPGFEDRLKREFSFIKYTPFRGILKVKGESLEEILEEIKKSKYIFKLIPIEREGSLEDIENLTLSLIEEKKPRGSFVVRCNRRGRHSFTSEELERALGEKIRELGYKVSLKNFDFKVNVEILQDKAYISLFTKDFKEIVFEENIRRMERINKYKERPISRAENKIRELIDKFPHIFKDLNVVLDIGSAPGGWVKVLSEVSKKVYAVDPAELKVKRENIVHIKKRAEEVEIEETLDLITNDTNLYPLESFSLIERFLKNLKNNGYIIYTLKGERGKVKDNLREVLSYIDKLENIKLEKVVKLKSNTRWERTLILRKVG